MKFVNTDLPDIIEVKNINQSYDNGKTWILKDYNLLIEDNPNQGQFITLMGASGCGKSTILEYICGLKNPTSGDVLINEVSGKNKDRVGMVFQHYSSLPWLNVVDNVAMGLKLQGVKKKERRKKAKEILSLVGLEGQEEKYPAQLSGGQKQRVAIARSVLANPRILALDEPFSALDVVTKSQMHELLIKIYDEMNSTILMVTHDINEAVYLSDVIYIMDANPGRVLHEIKIDLPKERTPDLKWTDKYRNYVRDIDQKMHAIDKRL